MKSDSVAGIVPEIRVSLPAAIVLIFRSRSNGQGGRFFDPARRLGIELFALGGLVGCMLIYAWAYRLTGVAKVVTDGKGVIYRAI